jgi:signal peptidase I
LVALAIAMAIRTFFLQPFKIPTGSMEPTLYGVESTNLLRAADFQIPTGLERVRQWFEGISYIHVVAENEGTLGPVEPPVRLAIFNIKQTLYIGGQPYTIWFPPDYGQYGLEFRAEMPLGQTVHKGEDVVKLQVSAGDHLFVDRLTYNFRKPERGEIVVFETKGIPAERRDGPGWHIPADQFYIKRLVGLGGEQIQIGKDRHLIINGERLDARTPHFQNVYGFDPKDPPRAAHYSGHFFREDREDQFFFAENTNNVAIPKDCLLVMGDNTMNSLDSRYWGYFPASAVIGKSFFVYWPITDRFGWGYHR